MAASVYATSLEQKSESLAGVAQLVGHLPVHGRLLIPFPVKAHA